MARIKRGSILENASGHIGKTVIVKQYKYGPVLSAFPDMSKAIKKKTPKQVKQRGLFADAVAYARYVLQNPGMKASYTRAAKAHASVYQAALTAYLNPKTRKVIEEKLKEMKARKK